MTADAHKMVENASESESGGGILNGIDSTKLAIGLGLAMSLALAYVLYKRRGNNGGGSGGDDGSDNGDDGGEITLEEEKEPDIEIENNPRDPLGDDERLLNVVGAAS